MKTPGKEKPGDGGNRVAQKPRRQKTGDLCNTSFSAPLAGQDLKYG